MGNLRKIMSLLTFGLFADVYSKSANQTNYVPQRTPEREKAFRGSSKYRRTKGSLSKNWLAKKQRKRKASRAMRRYNIKHAA